MRYNLNKPQQAAEQVDLRQSIKKLLPLLLSEKRLLLIAFVTVLIGSAASLLAPYLVGYIIDHFIKAGQYGQLFLWSSYLLAIYLLGLLVSYIQTKTVGTLGQRVLFTLRKQIFEKLQQLPISFFDQNKAGDLTSRINNDTDNLNRFFSQALAQFIGNAFSILGVTIFIFVLNWRLAVTALIPALFLLIVTRFLSPWIKNRNSKSLKALGNLSAEIQESLQNFKVIIAFNRRDYFRQNFTEVNQANYQNSIKAGIANTLLMPIYHMASNLANLLVLLVGILLIQHSLLTTGLLISFFLYLDRLYGPMRQMANLWSIFQTALASYDRITAILALETDLPILPSQKRVDTDTVIAFKKVFFRYGKTPVLQNISFQLKEGKTYAFVGPTGGGKTTTASLMARLYDPEKGQVIFEGQDLRSWPSEERAKKIGFILQEPFLFSGNIAENILYGNKDYQDFTVKKLQKLLAENNLDALIKRFPNGLETPVVNGGESLSLGQKQLIAFIRIVLRNPDLLILDEATANIDTVTENLLDDILAHLPKKTTLVVIAHRLNTIENADEIFFVNAGRITPAGSMQQAVDMLLHQKRKS